MHRCAGLALVAFVSAGCAASGFALTAKSATQEPKVIEVAGNWSCELQSHRIPTHAYDGANGLDLHSHQDRARRDLRRIVAYACAGDPGSEPRRGHLLWRPDSEFDLALLAWLEYVPPPPKKACPWRDFSLPGAPTTPDASVGKCVEQAAVQEPPPLPPPNPELPAEATLRKELLKVLLFGQLPLEQLLRFAVQDILQGLYAESGSPPMPLPPLPPADPGTTELLDTARGMGVLVDFVDPPQWDRAPDKVVPRAAKVLQAFRYHQRYHAVAGELVLTPERWAEVFPACRLRYVDRWSALQSSASDAPGRFVPRSDARRYWVAVHDYDERISEALTLRAGAAAGALAKARCEAERSGDSKCTVNNPTLTDEAPADRLDQAATRRVAQDVQVLGWPEGFVSERVFEPDRQGLTAAYFFPEVTRLCTLTQQVHHLQTRGLFLDRFAGTAVFEH